MGKIIILAYHDIDSDHHPTEKTDVPTVQTVVRLSEFESHMKYLFSAGYTVLSVREYLDKNKNNEVLDSKCIVLTFDDGHISNYTYALPILQKFSFHATFFVVAEFIGKPFYMGTDEIAEMLACGMEIGSHGLSHAYLTELPHEEVVREVLESKKKLESICGKHINVFAYPGGHRNKKIVQSVNDAGYEAAVSCITGKNSFKTNPFLLRRIELRRGTSSTEFKKAIGPKSILFFQCVDLGKLLMKRVLGLKKYELLRQRLYHLYPFKR